MSTITGEAIKLKEDAENYVRNIPTKTIDALLNESRKVREKAMESIISGLDNKSDKDNTLLQALPIALSDLEGSEFALSLIATLGMNGHYIDWGVVEQVYFESRADREEAANEHDDDYVDLVTHKIDLLLNMGENHNKYSENPRFYILMGGEYEDRGDLWKAIEYYNIAVEMGEKDGYLNAGFAYRELGLRDFALKIFEQGYTIFGDISFLKAIIVTYVIIGDLSKAKEYYHKLITLHQTEQDLIDQGRINKSSLVDSLDAVSVKSEKQKLGSYDILSPTASVVNDDKYYDEILPFIFFSGNIESDEELHVFEKFMADYIGENILIPSDSLFKLSIVANDYIENELEKIAERYGKVQEKGLDNLTEEEVINYRELLLRRLYLLQVDVITLKNYRFLEEYLEDINGYMTVGGLNGLELLREHFERHYADEVLNEEKVYMQRRDDSDVKDSIYKDIGLHIGIVGRIYFSTSFYDIQKNMISPLLTMADRESDLFGDFEESKLIESLNILKAEEDFFDTLRLETKRLYNEMVIDLDSRYGMFYRRTIQYIARDPDFFKEEDFPEVLLDYPDIAAFFFIEKILSGSMHTADGEELDEIISKYSLEKVTQNESIIFGLFLWETHRGLAINYFSRFPDILGNPYVIYVILEGIRLMSKDEQKAIIDDLNVGFQEELNAEGFFEHIESVFEKLNSMGDELSENDTEYMMLSLGNIALLKEEGAKIAKNNFLDAVEYGSTEAMLQAGDLYDDDGDYTKALTMYETAYTNESNISTLTKLLSFLIKRGIFDKAKSYLDKGISEGYDLWQYVFPYLLWQGKTDEAINYLLENIYKTELMRSVDKFEEDDMSEEEKLRIARKNNIFYREYFLPDTPEGTLDLLYDEISKIIKKDDVGVEKDLFKKKVLATYIHLRIFSFDEEGDIPLDDLMLHWQNIELVLGDISGMEMYRYINEILFKIVGYELEYDDSYENNEPKLALHLLNIYAYKIHERLRIMFSEAKIRGNYDELSDLFKTINNFVSKVSILLRRFPGSEDIVNSWKQSIIFAVHGVNIMEEDKFASTMIH